MIKFIFDAEILATNEKIYHELEFKDIGGLVSSDFKVIKKDLNLTVFDKTILNNMYLSVEVLKPSKDGSNFILQYSTENFWKLMDFSLEDILGCNYADLAPVFKECGLINILKKVNNGVGRVNNKIIIYENGNLISYLDEYCIKGDDGLIYFFTEDKTKEMQEFEKDWVLFNESKLAILNYHISGKVTRVNKGLIEVSGYTSNDFNTIGFENIVFEYESDSGSDSIKGTLSKLFNREIAVVNSKLKAHVNGGVDKVFSTVSSLINGNTIQIVCEEITDLKYIESKSLNLERSLNEVLKLGNIIICSVSNGVYTWNDEIYDILEIEPDDYSSDVNLIVEHMFPEDLDNFITHNDLNNIKNLDNNSFFEFSTRIKTGKGNTKYLVGQTKGEYKNNILYNGFGLIQDITDYTVATNKISELEEILDEIRERHNIVLYTYKNGKYNFTSGIFDMLEINEEEFSKNINYLQKMVIPEDKSIIPNAVNSTNKFNPFFNLTVRVKTADPNIIGGLKYISAMGKCILDENDNLVYFLGSIIDETERFLRENELRELSEDRKILLQEVHHRVKNNLQIILSLLNLELRYNPNHPENTISQTRNRINSMALIHEEIYRSSDIAHVNLKDYIIKEIDDLFRLHEGSNICPCYNLENLEISMNKAIPLGLILNELAINTTKYAFPGDEDNGNFYVDLNKCSDDKTVIIDIYDDGIGLSDDFELAKSNSLGFTIVKNLVRQLEGELSVLENVPGFGISIKFVDDELKFVDV